MSDLLASRAVRGAAKIAAASYLSNFASVAAGVVIPRFLGKEAYGEYAFLTASFMLAAQLSRLGLQLVITRQFAPLYSVGKLEKAAGLYKAIFFTGSAGGLFAAIICFLFLEATNPFQFPTIASIIVFFLILAWSLSQSLFSLNLGAQRYGYWSLTFVMRSFTRLLLVIPGFIIGGIPGAVGGILLGECLTGFVGLRLSYGLLPLKETRPDFPLLWSYLRLAALAYANEIINNLRRYLGVMLIAFATYSTALTGYYEIAMRVVFLVSAAILQTTGSLTPTLSVLHEQKDTSRLLAWVDLAMRFGFLLFVVIWGVFILLGQSLVVFLLGDKFQPVYPLVSILLLSLPFFWVEVTYNQVCNVYRRPELNLLSGLVWLVSFVMLGAWGLDTSGLHAFAAAYSVSSAVSCGVSCLVVWKYMGLRIATVRLLILLLCSSPFIVALFQTQSLFERIVAAALATGTATLLAHVTTSLRVDEIRALYHILKGKMA